MAKLNQILAIEAGVKAKAQAALTAAYQLFQKSAPLSGLSRSYQPTAEDGEQLPPESTLVQVKAWEVIGAVANELTEEWDITFAKDAANQQARADVVVDGKVLIKDAPVPYLLFLEKELTDLRTFMDKLPVLDPADTWTYDTNRAIYVTPPVQTVRTKKIPKALVGYEATDKHPAQVQWYTEDVPAGRWTLLKFSGALPSTRRTRLIERVTALQQAVKLAREQANMTEAPVAKNAAGVFAWLLAE